MPGLTPGHIRCGGCGVVGGEERYPSAFRQAGVELTRAHDVAKATEIEAWVDQVAASYNVLPVDAQIFRCWARLMHGRSDQLARGAVIAATAIVHNLIVVTRNLRDFVPFGVRTLDPFIAR